jgi:hypothetical protein
MAAPMLAELLVTLNDWSKVRSSRSLGFPSDYGVDLLVTLDVQCGCTLYPVATALPFLLLMHCLSATNQRRELTIPTLIRQDYEYYTVGKSALVYVGPTIRIFSSLYTHQYSERPSTNEYNQTLLVK